MNRLAAFAFTAAALVPLTAIGCSASDPSSSCHPADPACSHVSGGDDSGSAGDDASASPGDSSAQMGDSGTTAHDGGNGPGEGGGAHDSGTTLPPEGGAGGFAAVCDPQNNQCPASFPTCFTFNAKGNHCTKACQGNGDCPAPSPGCSGMGVCRIP